MALQFSLKRFLTQLGLQALLGIHLLESGVLCFQFLEPLHERRIHTAELGPLLINQRRTDIMLTG